MIDPNEAPEGYVAVKAKHACAGCSFLDERSDCTLNDFTCYPSQRSDGENVIFIPREESKSEAESTNHSVNALKIELADLIKKNEALENKVSNQRQRIRYLEGATNHATGTPLSKARDEASRWKAACFDRDELIAKLKAQLTASLEAIARMR